jgi:hypothetical protein
MRPMGELVPYRPALASAIPPKLGSGPGDPPTTTWRGVEFRAGETMRIVNGAQASFGCFGLGRPAPRRSRPATAGGPAIGMLAATLACGQARRGCCAILGIISLTSTHPSASRKCNSLSACLQSETAYVPPVESDKGVRPSHRSSSGPHVNCSDGRASGWRHESASPIQLLSPAMKTAKV